MSNFNYNNYIGDHMNEPLKVEVSLKPVHNLSIESKSNIDELNLNTFASVCTFTEFGIYQYKPIIKSIVDLTDEEIIYVYGGRVEVYIERKPSNITLIYRLDYNDVLAQISNSGMFFPNNPELKTIQQILNRLYSLHISIDYDELIQTNKAVRKV